MNYFLLPLEGGRENWKEKRDVNMKETGNCSRHKEEFEIYVRI